MAFPYNLFKGLSIPQANYPIDRRDLLNHYGDNTIQSSRYIDPITKDFVISSTNHFQGWNAVDQGVVLAINTTFNSSSQPGFGQNFGSIKVITPNIKSQVDGIVRQALAFQIANNQITLNELKYSNLGNGQISVEFTYFNNTTGVQNPVQFILQ